jgi:hypothetical protein
MSEEIHLQHITEDLYDILNQTLESVHARESLPFVSHIRRTLKLNQFEGRSKTGRVQSYITDLLPIAEICRKTSNMSH